ncbi:protein export cytoplasm protein SecA ATPase RNA helicase [Lachnospiraceae bacterium KM106-2]|nr:protein export cytoplasm protein SecA ATPase RNA helicase [Lachnospiraceae bacterium KM106-2]
MKGRAIMSLLQEWRDYAYAQDTNQQEGAMFWANYFNIEKGIYEQILATPETVVTGTVKELADKYETDLSHFVGFLDGINDSLKTANPIEEMDENTTVSLDFDSEKLYYNMCEARADWLYELPQWDNILTKERRKELFLEQRKSHTVVKEKKVGRNDPCPCGSGKKYKKCCGANQ